MTTPAHMSRARKQEGMLYNREMKRLRETLRQRAIAADTALYEREFAMERLKAEAHAQQARTLPWPFMALWRG